MRFLIFTGLFLLALGCASQKEAPKENPQTAGPQVQKWMNTVRAEAETRLPVIISSNKPLADSLLNKIGPNRYTGRLTQEQLNVLLKNPDVKRISTGKEKLH